MTTNFVDKALNGLLSIKSLTLALPLAAAGGLALAVMTGEPAATAQTKDAGAAEAKAGAQSEAAKVFSSEQRAGIEAIVKEYLLAHPELFLEIQSALETKLEAMQAEQFTAAIADNAEALFRRANAPAIGDPKADVTVVEFFDYNCGFCKRGFPQLAKLIENDKNVRVVFKELPILSEGSLEASRVALAAKAQGKYWEMHRALMAAKGTMNGEHALKIAEKHGLDVAKLKEDMKSPEVTKEIENVRDLAQKMGINGTPHYLVADKSIAGAPENLYEQLVGLVKETRDNGGCKVC
ncbi:DSBA oxidoreductase [Candidatus Filomicrobium marinum]|uniref:DSBA oxidoreductase n=1 Tax=Candidatus Filomicrobium marinum TaxID=1608628 RepID=A0A0D6JAH8_9HYPH|nr:MULTISPECIES: DsbA family protein [Filomicrobium]MCV0368881.1 DsbA family protein [Filomicrobium sp.]CFW97445.1 DSBA oxidoreductase [Candidatus Filomicrobium marinum]CPR14668.1 DSBA oxidoreductase [Candidatus Filomicrobium marinum]